MYFPEVDGFNLNFEENDYDTIYFNLILGTIFFIILAHILMILIVGCLKVVGCGNERIQTAKNKISKKLFWGGILRLLIESYFELVLAVGINAARYRKSIGDYAFTGVIVSNIFATFFAIASLVLPFFILIFYSVNTGRWRELEFVKKWGTVLDGMDTDPHPEKKGYNRRWALFFPLMMLCRRIVFVVTVIAMNNFVWLQLALQFACTIASMIYLLQLWPHESPTATRTEVFNEVINLILMYHLLCFTDFVPGPEVRYSIGYTYILFVVISMTIHISMLFFNAFLGIKAWFMLKKRIINYKRALANNVNNKTDTEATQNKSTLMKSTKMKLSQSQQAKITKNADRVR